ncbi:MAG TPA: tRNA (adenosine(37)-N6)-threonylcarbamoyltransferase complex ATPase subunit type 1 TsaE [Clostridiales bacterium]|nr:tRNA (adenosine(37)-N6)-threonylcarbamoyltransferase complex ATPase subunit type 1 TsaE [Clostridiales bacterium]
MYEFVTRSPDETEKFGERIAKCLTPGMVLALEGDLGAGKTCFVKGLAKGLGYTGEVSSPTFALVNEYRGGRIPLYHFDMYRVSSWDDLYSTGFFDYLEADGALAVEWSENIAAALPEDTVYVTFEKIDDTVRRITVGEIAIEDTLA